ncbi:hypothetical protein ACFL2U_01055 [Patescibacteria group bacterium]
MSKKKKTETLRVEIDKGAVVRSISRNMFGHNPTKVIPNKTKYNRKQKHQKKYDRDHNSGVF